MKDCCEMAEILLEAYDETLAEYQAAESVIHSRAVSIDEAFVARGSVARQSENSPHQEPVLDARE
jgi:hypothetical protein